MIEATENHDSDVASSGDESATLQSLLASKRKRQALKRQRMFEIPGYDGLLGAKFQCADATGLMLDKAAGLDDDEITTENVTEVLRGRCSLMARACVEVFVRSSTDKPWRPLREIDGGAAGVPVRFDERLVRYLGGTPDDLTPPEGQQPSASDAVRWVIGEASDLNLAGLFMELVTWFAKETPDADDELVGESSAAS